VQKQFFPAASRPEIMIDIWLPQGASLKATEREVKRVEALLDKDEHIASWSSYIGNGAPRFFLSLDQQLFADNFGQMVIVTKGLKEREIVKQPPGSSLRVGRRLLVASAAARGAPGKRPAGRLSGAVPRPRRRPCRPARQRGGHST
jgi:multidrug efflux pump subunit AcrB